MKRKLLCFFLIILVLCSIGLFGCSGGKDGADGADGQTPFIGTNGNWWIGTTDTGVLAQGTNGTDGAPGADGIDGEDEKHLSSARTVTGGSVKLTPGFLLVIPKKKTWIALEPTGFFFA